MSGWKLPDIMSFDKPLERLKPHIDNEDEKKKLFGIELGKGLRAFDAACAICGQDTSLALYISQNWLNDPVVIANKEKYIKAVYSSEDQLDAEEFAALLLKMANEKNASNTFYVLEGKDRIKCLELYGQAKNFLGKNAPTVQNNLVFKSISVKFVKPKEKIIEETPSEELQIENTNNPRLKLKLVS